MAIKKGDLVKVIEAIEEDRVMFGIIKGETYKVVNLFDGDVYINAGKGDRVMFDHQLKKVKKKSKKDLKIQELENTIEKILTYLVNK